MTARTATGTRHCPRCGGAKRPSDEICLACAITRKRTVTTLELRSGDRVRLPGGIVRTVATVAPSGYLNVHNATIYTVTYQEGDTSHNPPPSSRWSGGNTAVAGTTWDLA